MISVPPDLSAKSMVVSRHLLEQATVEDPAMPDPPGREIFGIRVVVEDDYMERISAALDMPSPVMLELPDGELVVVNFDMLRKMFSF
jgi:hypothetical protein